ncbi:putative methyltransferase tarbp1 [Fagus crenata]
MILLLDLEALDLFLVNYWSKGYCAVRCLIMQSFLGIGWKNYGNCAKSVPEAFVLGPFMQGLNDPVHHKDFGLFST